MHPIAAIFIFIISSLNHANSGILDLSAYELDEFKSELENYDSLLVNFYAPYCQHCKALTPAYDKVAKKMYDEDPPVTLAKVDCTSSTGTKICREFNVNGYPNLQLFKQGEYQITYEGERTVDKMVNWLDLNARIVSKRVSSFAQLNKYIEESEEPVVIAIFSNNDDPMVERWQLSAKIIKAHWNYRDVEFYHIFEEYARGSSARLTSIGLSKSRILAATAIVLHRPKWLENPHEPTNIIYKMDSQEDLVNWVYRKAFGIVIWRSRDNEEDLQPPLVVAYYAVDFKKKHKFSHKWRNVMVVGAKANLDLNFAISSSSTFRKILSRQNLKPPRDEEPPLFVAYDIFGVMYVMREEFTSENFDKFIWDFKMGEIAPHVKSEEPPTDNEDRDVKVVVGATFNKYVTVNKRDVFMCFYAPWCKHSKEFLPIWDELARQLKKEHSIDIVKMDAIANEIPSQFGIPQYPTLYFVSGKTKKIIKYADGPAIHQLIQFVARRSTIELDGFDREGAPKSVTKNVTQEMESVLTEEAEGANSNIVKSERIKNEL